MNASAAGSGSGADGYTDTQKKQIAQALQAEEDRVAQQEAMNSRIDELNRSGQVWFDAQKKTANEQSLAGGGSGVTTTADRAERDSGKVIDARTQLGWDSGSLDLMDPGRNPSAAGKLYPAQMGLPAAVDAQFSQQKAQQDALRQQALDQLDMLAKMADPYRQKLSLMEADNERVQGTRNRMMDLFGDPGLALTSASYKDPEALYSDYTKQQLGQQQDQNRALTGYGTPEEQKQALSTQEWLQNYANSQSYDAATQRLAKETGEDPAQIQAVQASQVYGDIYNQVMELGTPSTQDVQYLISSLAAEQGDESLLSLIPLMVADLKAKGLLYNDTYEGA